jgi:spore coat protein U-like protein
MKATTPRPNEPMETDMTKFFAKTAAAALIASAIVAPAMAQNASGTIQLKGNVALSCTIAVQDLNQSLALKAGETAKTVGSVTETCNSGSGYKITLASANAGKLKSGNFTIDYSVNYDGQGGALTSQMVVDRATAQFGKKSDLKVTIAASDQYIAGDYADTVTVTIAAK